MIGKFEQKVQSLIIILNITYLGSKEELEKFVREFESKVQEKETQLVEVAKRISITKFKSVAVFLWSVAEVICCRSSVSMTKPRVN